MDRELEECLNELHGVCEHLEPPLSRWQKIQKRCSQWWSEYREAVLGWTIWLFIIVGLPMLASKCNGKNPAEPPKSPHGDVIAQYTITYYADGAEEWEEMTDDQWQE
jgi:hypothetical protein